MVEVSQLSVSDFIHRGPWWKNRNLVMLNLCLVIPFCSSVVNGIDASMLNGLQILPQWQAYFNYPTGFKLGMINSAQWIAALVVSVYLSVIPPMLTWPKFTPVSPFFSDYMGRRITLVISAAVTFVGVLIQAFSTSLGMFMGARALIGVGLAFALNAAPLLISELSYPTQRAELTSLFNTFWYLGSTISSWICFAAYEYVTGSELVWRLPTLVQAVFPLLQMIFVYFIPESPRYLVATGRESQAARVLARWHTKNGDQRDPLVLFEMAEIRHALKLEREASAGVWHLSYWLCFVTPGNRKRSMVAAAIALFGQWSGNGLVSFYISIILESIGIYSVRQQSAINGILQIFNFACAVTGAMLVERCGRRGLFLISTAGMMIVFPLWTLSTAIFDKTGSHAAAKATVVFIFSFYLFYDLAYTPLLISYTLEILPYRIRARAFALRNVVIYLALSVNQFFNPWALSSIGWKYYITYCCWLVFELWFVWRYIIETKGRTLEETAALYDGENVPRDIEKCGGEAAVRTSSVFIPLTTMSNPQSSHSAEKLNNSLQEEGSTSQNPSGSRLRSDSV